MKAILLMTLATLLLSGCVVVAHPEHVRPAVVVY